MRLLEPSHPDPLLPFTLGLLWTSVEATNRSAFPFFQAERTIPGTRFRQGYGGGSLFHAVPLGLSWKPHAGPSSSWAWLFQVIAANKINPLHQAQPDTLQAGEGLGPQALSPTAKTNRLGTGQSEGDRQETESKMQGAEQARD